MPSIVGKNKKKQELINNLQQIYDSISRLHHVSPGDFPKLSHMQSILSEQDFTNFPSLKERLIEQVDVMLTQEIPKLMQMIPIVSLLYISQHALLYFYFTIFQRWFLCIKTVMVKQSFKHTP